MRHLNRDSVTLGISVTCYEPAYKPHKTYMRGAHEVGKNWSTWFVYIKIVHRISKVGHLNNAEADSHDMDRNIDGAPMLLGKNATQ